MNVRPSALLTTVRGAYGLIRCMQMIRPSFRDHLSFLSTWEVDKRQIEVCDTRAALVHRSGNILALHHETSASVRWPRLLRRKSCHFLVFLDLFEKVREVVRRTWRSEVDDDLESHGLALIRTSECDSDDTTSHQSFNLFLDASLQARGNRWLAASAIMV